MLHYKENSYASQSSNIFYRNKDIFEDKKKFINFVFYKLSRISLDEYNEFINVCIGEYYEKHIYPFSNKYKRVQQEKQRINRIKNKIRIQKTKCYIIKDDSNNTYKIGASIEPLKREKTLQSQKPNLKLIKIFENNIEKELHELYKHCRLRGEWFKLNNIQLEYICKNYK